MTSTVLAALREATGPHHARLDAGLGLPDGLHTTAGRRRVAARFYGWQAGVERAIGDHLAQVAGLRLSERRRAHRFSADLAVLGLDVDELPVSSPAPASGPAQALGLLYVAEGSTLGGKVIGRRLQAAGQGLAGLGFLDPYGPRAGELWRDSLQVLDRETRTPAFQDQAVDGAVMGFEAAERWFIGAEAAA